MKVIKLQMVNGECFEFDVNEIISIDFENKVEVAPVEEVAEEEQVETFAGEVDLSNVSPTVSESVIEDVPAEEVAEVEETAEKVTEDVPEVQEEKPVEETVTAEEIKEVAEIIKEATEPVKEKNEISDSIDDIVDMVSNTLNELEGKNVVVESKVEETTATVNVPDAVVEEKPVEEKKEPVVDAGFTMV